MDGQAERSDTQTSRFADSADASSDAWESPIPILGTHPLPTFPVHTLPRWLQEWVQAVSDSMQVPIDLPAVLSLAVVSTIVAKVVRVVVQVDRTEPLNIFALLALSSAERKSAVLAAALAPLREHEDLSRRQAAIISNAVDAQRDVLEQAYKQAARRAAKAAGADRQLNQNAADLRSKLAGLKAQPLPRLLADDITPEKLARLAADQGGRIAVLSAEAGALDRMMSTYSSGPADVFLKGFSGEPHQVDRVRQPSVRIQSLVLTLLLAVQPEVLRNLPRRRGFRGQGLLGRFLFSLPQSRVGLRQVDQAPVDEQIALQYSRKLSALLTIDVQRDDDGEITPHDLVFHDGARTALAAFDAKVERQLGPDGELATITDWGGRLAGKTARIAGLLNLADHGALKEQIDVDQVLRAIEIAKYFEAHAKAAFDDMGIDPVVEDARLLLAWIKRERREGFAARDMYNAVRGRTQFRGMAGLRQPLELLVQHLVIRQQVRSGHGLGRKPSPFYEVNPHVFDPQNAQK